MEKEENIGLFRKLSELRKDILTKDWVDDKYYMINNKPQYGYLSADKVKRTLAPLFCKHGVEMRVKFSELEYRPAIGNMSQHWTIRLDVTLIDTETGESDTSTVYGEAGDSGDKGVNKAQTCALKQWVFSEFLIADGVDPDASDSGPAVSGFYRKSDEEKEEVVSKVLSQSMKPMPKAIPKKEAPKAEEHEAEAAPAPVKEEPKEAPKAEPKTEPKVEPKTEAPAVGGFKPTGPQAKAIARIESVWEERARAGEVTPEEYNKMSMARATLASSSDAVAFIKTYKVG